ncbi:hypothetical protein AVEN_190289-1 [Araneus ventricosus]|uniref:Uncharacterized protein n=1 Tax=Araneus ventricosus TaxID=182803 RepID=A0A4Y2PXP4_ARAVE|nr:hypothetical protein AVEN_190289-1 [Araneus ventricosus]
MCWQSVCSLMVEGWDGEWRLGCLVITNHGQTTRTTPEMTLTLQTSAPHQREDSSPLTCDLMCNRPNSRRIFSGIGFRVWKTFGPENLPRDHRGH